MAHHIKIHNIPHKNIYLIFGTRTKKDLLYYDEMKQLQKELPGFHYHPHTFPGRMGWPQGLCSSYL